MRKISLLAILVLSVSTMFAATWPSSGPARKVVTLVVCSNNQSPRLLAELIQAESKQPYLLLPAPQSNDTRVFFVPAKGAAHQIPNARISHFVQFLAPRRIVVLGGPEFVPESTLRELGTNIPVFVARCSDWERVAEELTYLLNISGLGRDYKKLRDQMLNDSRMYRPISKPAAPAAAVEATPVALENTPAATEATPAVTDDAVQGAAVETSVALEPAK